MKHNKEEIDKFKQDVIVGIIYIFNEKDKIAVGVTEIAPGEYEVEVAYWGVGISFGKEIWGYVLKNIPATYDHPPDMELIETEKCDSYGDAFDHLMNLILGKKMEWLYDEWSIKTMMGGMDDPE